MDSKDSQSITEYIQNGNGSSLEANVLHARDMEEPRSWADELVVAWNEFYDELDTEKVVITLSLFILCFLVLFPSRLLRHASRIGFLRRFFASRLQHSNSQTKEQHSKIKVTPGSPACERRVKSVGFLSTLAFSEDDDDNWSGQFGPAGRTSRSVGSTVCTGIVVSEEEEDTEEELFLKNWNSISMSVYRKLVLPPVCKLVEKPRKIASIATKNAEAANKTKKSAKVGNDDDDPLRRLQNYFNQFLYLLRCIWSYDYANAVWTVLNWLQYLIMLRSHKAKPVVESAEDEEDDDDDVSKASSTAPLSSINRHNSNEIDQIVVSEEKKEDITSSPIPPVCRPPNPSFYEPVEEDLGEADVGELAPSSAYSPSSTLRKRMGGGKKKDALESYRLSNSAARSKSPLPAKAAVPADPHHHANHHVAFENATKLLPPIRQRNTSEPSMSFFDAAHSDESLKQLQVEVPVPDRNGYTVGDEFLPSSQHTPLLVFVNSRSGPQQGQFLIIQLRRLLNPIQVWDLADGGPEIVLESFCVMSRVRILVCGGDGTVSWIISALEKMNVDRWPPIAILPLGTGNDLARIHGWGGGYNNESLISILGQVAEAYISLLDRWEVKIESKKGRVKATKSFFNYLGVGVDAQAALQVHRLRESKPTLFFSRAVNKAWYAIFGAEDAIKASHANLPREVTLTADGVEVPLPPDSQGILLLNIDSYSGGVEMWSHGVKAINPTALTADQRMRSMDYLALQATDLSVAGPPRRRSFMPTGHYDRASRTSPIERVDSFDDLTIASFPLTEEDRLARVTACNKPSSCQDGMLDIVSVRGPIHLGQIRVGLSNAQKICQCKEVTIVIKKKVAVQIDGEPWRQNSCTIRITRKKDPAIMLHRSPDESGGVETEMAKLLDWAEDRNLIDRSVHAALMKEYSRRIESKTRQRRVRSQDNLMFSFKRAIGTTHTGEQAMPYLSNVSF